MTTIGFDRLLHDSAMCIKHTGVGGNGLSPVVSSPHSERSRNASRRRAAIALPPSSPCCEYLVPDRDVARSLPAADTNGRRIDVAGVLALFDGLGCGVGGGELTDCVGVDGASGAALLPLDAGYVAPGDLWIRRATTRGAPTTAARVWLPTQARPREEKQRRLVVARARVSGPPATA